MQIRAGGVPVGAEKQIGWFKKKYKDLKKNKAWKDLKKNSGVLKKNKEFAIFSKSFYFFLSTLRFELVIFFKVIVFFIQYPWVTHPTTNNYCCDLTRQGLEVLRTLSLSLLKVTSFGYVGK